MKKESYFEGMRPNDAYVAVLKQREADGTAFYRKYHEEFEDIACPACGSPGEYIFTKYGFRHRSCLNCQTTFCSPRPPENLLSTYYNSYHAPQMWTKLLLQTDERRKELQYQPRVQKIVSRLEAMGYAPGGLAVDLGAGNGTFARCLLETGFFNDVTCLDLSEDCIRVCEKKGLRSILGDISHLDTESVDLICMNDFIEHVFDPAFTIQHCRRVLMNNGFVSIATPNGMGFDFLILKELTRNITPPEHLNYFNPRSLNLLLSAHGFETVLMQTPGVLDVEIIRKEIESGFSLIEKNEFLHMLFRMGFETLENFQKFISENLLSSHMLCLVQKKEVI